MFLVLILGVIFYIFRTFFCFYVIFYFFRERHIVFLWFKRLKVVSAYISLTCTFSFNLRSRKSNKRGIATTDVIGRIVWSILFKFFGITFWLVFLEKSCKVLIFCVGAIFPLFFLVYFFLILFWTPLFVGFFVFLFFGCLL